MKRASGMTLIEFVIGAAISLLVLYALGTGLQFMQASSTRLQKQSMQDNELAVMTSHLKRFMQLGALKLYGFSGKTPSSSPADRTLLRAMVPIPDTCADLSACACADPHSCVPTASLLFATPDKKRTTSVSVICSPRTDTWIVDLANQTYGTGLMNAGQLSVQAVAGGGSEPFPTGAGQVLGLMNPPGATLWSLGWVKSVTASKDAASGNWTYQIAGDPTPYSFPPDCLAQLQGPAASPTVSSLYAFRVSPVSFAQFSGGKALLDDPNISSAEGAFPMRIVPIFLRNVGKILIANPRTKAMESYLAVRECAYSGTITCPGPNFLTVASLKAMVVTMQYAMTLSPATKAGRYELGKFGDPYSSDCTGPSCAGLPIQDPANIPVNFGGTESPDNLSSAGFSFLKMDALQEINLSFWREDGHKDAIDVPF